VILDTNGLSAMAEGNPVVTSILDRQAEVGVPVIVLGEYLYGVRRSRDRARLERWLEHLLDHCAVLVADERTARAYADVRGELTESGRPIPVNDLWIAALVRQHGQPLLSRDQHFDSVPGLKRIGW